MFMRHCKFIAFLAGTVACVTVSGTGPAFASQAVGWWGGTWVCSIDGRPARMRWVVVDASDTQCNGDTCTTSSGVAWKGSFSDNGSRWVPLTNPRLGDQGGMYFNHADGNRWYLRKPTRAGDNLSTSGWTTWEGARYPLSCRR